MPHPSHDTPMPFVQQRLEEMRCPKCGQCEKPRIEYMKRHTVYSACDLHYPECLRLFCQRCGHEEWMHTKDYIAPTPEEIQRSRDYWNQPLWKLLFAKDKDVPYAT